jgi:hypothetical protein
MSTTLPTPIVIMMASHEHRLHHYLWHQVRNSWWEYSDSERNEIRQLGWEPPRPAYVRSTPPRVGVINNSGEDFLYMHRVMIASVNMRLREIGDPAYPKIEGWKQIPAPGDQEYPTPPGWDTGIDELNTYLENVKSDDFYNQRVKPAESQFTDNAYLKTISLGELGARLEFTIHNWLHMRFCSEVSEMRPDPDEFSTTIDTKWDDPHYNWLGDTYASHVHPLFWKLHGWVDDRVEDWKKAHQISGEINWVGKWVGDLPAPPAPRSLHEILSVDPEKEMAHEHPSLGHDHHMRMMKVLKLINKSGVCSHFYDTLDPQFNK